MDTSIQTKKDVYAIATEHVLQYLERGTVPWLTSFTDSGIPTNPISGKEFRGINVFLLASLGYPKNFFLTPKQLEEIGGTVKEGAKGHVVFYWKWKDKSEGDEPNNEKQKPLLRYFYAYNIAQCEGITKGRFPKIPKPENSLAVCEAIVGTMPNCPMISHGIHQASYMPTLDCIDIPKKSSYPNDESYYCTLLRTLIHSSGHESRLNRKEVMEATVTDTEYHSAESLIGDIGAAQLCSIAGIQYVIRKDIPAYCNEWIPKLKKNKQLIVYASTQAQRAVDYILNRIKEYSKR